MNAVSLSQVQSSFARCVANPRFFDRFYDIFMSSHPAIRPMFVKTDMARQKHLLRHGLMSALMFAENDVMARTCIDRIRASHSSSKLNIAPDLYRFWIESLLQAVAECDPEWLPEMTTLWRQAVQPAVAHIQAGYS